LVFVGTALVPPTLSSWQRVGIVVAGSRAGSHDRRGANAWARVAAPASAAALPCVASDVVFAIVYDASLLFDISGRPLLLNRYSFFGVIAVIVAGWVTTQMGIS
jgi:hypothetical protein